MRDLGGGSAIAAILESLVLTRLPVPDGQRKLFNALAEAPEGITYTGLTIRLDRTAAQLAGILGAFGRRINNTPGVPKVKANAIALFLDYRPADDTYSLKAHALEALKAEGLL